MSSRVKFAVFDCDGTLVDSQHAIGAGMAYAWAQEALAVPSRLALRRQVGLPLEQAIANLHPDGDVDQHHRMAANYRNAFHDPSIHVMDDEPLFPGCVEVLDILLSQGVILGVATGKGMRGLKSTLERHGLTQYFKNLKTADDGPGKPNPLILLDAMAEVGASPAETIMIGDTVFDIGTAVNAKIASVGVSWGYHEPAELMQAGAAIIIDDYYELPKVLETIWEGV